MLTAIGLFLLGLVLLALGGDSIVKGAAGLAQRFGLTPFTTGVVLVAFATSLPELAVNLMAIVHGQSELALGNAVGSNVANVGLTLGVAAIAAPLVVRWRVLSPLLVVLVLGTLAILVLGADGMLSRLEGVMLLLAFALVFAFALLRGQKESAEVREEIAQYAQTSTLLAQNAIRFIVGALLLWAGAAFVVGGAGVRLFGLDLSEEGAAGIGHALGLSPVLTGLMPVAIGTALPELAAAIAASRRGQADMVMGHVIGASVFNIFVIVGGMAALFGLPLPMTNMMGGLMLPLGYEVLAALAFALMLYPVLRGDLRISQAEGGVLATAFIAWIAFELVLAGK